ncbi:alpha/beta hydrolase [Kineococcus glutinatus]|uniref:AB hydrolase-1 domain-containing protein n=1 Tax=Kineococcus glutinatus TaxID=1070872 RepID=A0ABP9I502_9ACTN
MELLGTGLVGSGPLGVVVLNDWISDAWSWGPTRPYLDTGRCTWALTDLRGYGRSRHLPGPHDLRTAVADVLALADSLGWARFAVVGHSMSSLVALHLAQHCPDRLVRAAVLCPPPPAGFGADEAGLAAPRAVARGDDEVRRARLSQMWGERLGASWLELKLRRWREAADPEAVAGYVAMFARDGLPEPAAPVRVPLLAVTGEEDVPVMRAAAVRELLAPLRPDVEVVPLAQVGHYPMQEAPPLLAAVLGRFLAQAPAGT